MNEVSWKVLEIDSNNQIIVEFNDNTNKNVVYYKWEGDIDVLRSRIASDAVQYRDVWWKQYDLNLFHRQDLLAFSGITTSANN